MNEIKFLGYNIIDFNMVYEEINFEDKLDTKVSIEIYENTNKKNQKKAILIVNTNSKDKKIQLKMEGVFEFPSKSKEEDINLFMRTSAPSIIYPYCRSFISMVTAFDSNEVVLLPIFNFNNLK